MVEMKPMHGVCFTEYSFLAVVLVDWSWRPLIGLVSGTALSIQTQERAVVLPGSSQVVIDVYLTQLFSLGHQESLCLILRITGFGFLSTCWKFMSDPSSNGPPEE